MFTEYTTLPDSSKVWVYQANRELSQEDIEYISAKAILFIEDWTRHGDNLKGSFTIKYNQFLVIAVDESFNSVSGCSIDASVRFVKGLEQELGIDLMDKMNVSFKDGDIINTVKLPEFQQYAKDQKITKDTIVFNNLVTTKNDFETKWEVSAEHSWHNRFLA